MNCPMCGAPLSPNDYECPKCYTKRSDMGLPYNNNSTYGGNNGGYGSYNQNYGNNGNYSGLNNNSAIARADRNSKRAIGWVIAVAVIILIAVFMCFIRPNLFKKFDMGNFTVELPRDCSEDSLGLFNLNSALKGLGSGKYFRDSKIQFAYVSISVNDSERARQFEDQPEELIDRYDMALRDMMTGYTKLSSTSDTIEFKSFDNGIEYYCKTKLMIKDNEFYVIMCMCESKHQSSMSPKISRIMNSIKFK